MGRGLLSAVAESDGVFDCGAGLGCEGQACVADLAGKGLCGLGECHFWGRVEGFMSSVMERFVCKIVFVK